MIGFSIVWSSAEVLASYILVLNYMVNYLALTNCSRQTKHQIELSDDHHLRSLWSC